MNIDWKKFKEIASKDIEADGAYVYRGQCDATWSLISSLFRTDIVTNSNIIEYVSYILPKVQEPVEAWACRSWDLTDYHRLAEFIAFLQHNGFPTPLLILLPLRILQPISHLRALIISTRKSENVTIYRFNRNLWGDKFPGKTDIADTKPKVSLITPYIRGNNKMAIQQGLFLYSNVADIEGYIRSQEEFEGQYLSKYTLDVTERPLVIKELSLMGISAVQLNPSIESICKKALEDIIGLIPMRKPKLQMNC